MITVLFICYLMYFFAFDAYATCVETLEAIFGNSLLFCAVMIYALRKMPLCRFSYYALAAIIAMSMINFVDSIYTLCTDYYFGLINCIVAGIGSVASITSLLNSKYANS